MSELITLENQKQDIVFLVQDKKEILKLCGNGDIFVKGKLVENDKEIVGALREFVKGQALLSLTGGLK